MNNNELLEKLNKLKEIKLDSGWKSQTRAVLFSQVSNSVVDIEVSAKEKAAIFFKKVLSFSSQPAMITFGVFAVFAFGIFGAQASKNIKPGNTFYTARILSEKAQLAVTFDQEKKEKLNVKLASARAKEITEVLSNTDINKEENKKKVEKLADAFKSEISNVKSGIENLNRIKEEKLVAVSIDNTSSEDDAVVGIGSVSKDDDSGKVFAVESERDDKGMEVYTAPVTVDIAVEVKNDEIAPVIEDLSQATTSKSFDLRLSEAEDSFIANDFAAAKQILEQVNDLIDDIDKDEIKNEASVATSAPAVDVVDAASDTATSADEEVK